MPPGYSRTRLWIQIGVIVLMVLVIQYFDLVVNGTVDANRFNIPLLGPLFGAMRAATKAHNAGIVLLANVAVNVIVPVVLMLLLGVRWRELGFGKGYHSWRTLALWRCCQLVRRCGALNSLFIRKAIIRSVFCDDGIVEGRVHSCASSSERA